VRLPGLITLNLFTDPVLSIRAGDIIDGAAAAVGVSKTVGWRWFREAARRTADQSARLVTQRRASRVGWT
jgi:hypothetical protein